MPASWQYNWEHLEAKPLKIYVPLVAFLCYSKVMDILSYHDLYSRNIKSRKIRTGPESDLVDSFLDSYQNLLNDSGYELSVLIEPFMEIGYPDIVAVSWDKQIFKHFNEKRFNINKLDIKLLNHLSLNSNKTADDLNRELGFDTRTIRSSLSRLEEADLVLESSSVFEAKPLGDIFAPKKVIAIEAKISNWKDAFQQAQLNHWFSSESYVLFPGLEAREELLEYSQNSRVGLFMGLKGNFNKLTSFSENEIPRSYGSWYLNELLYRVAHV